MKSYIYTGQVRHRRFAPLPHEFQYSIFMLYLDLAEVPKLFEKYWFWSTKRFSLACFRRKDHYGDEHTDLDCSIRKRIEEKTGIRPKGPIRLLTHLRYFGYCFNPVSFYYVFDEQDEYLETIVAEVNNTPWGEQHTYVLPNNLNLGTKRNKHFKFSKDFHVSPFMPIDLNYDWRFMQPDKKISVHMENYEHKSRNNLKVFDATLVLKRKPINSMSLATTLLHFPFMTAKVISAIYWQALKMCLKGFPFHDHPKHNAKTTSAPSTMEKSTL